MRGDITETIPLDELVVWGSFHNLNFETETPKFSPIILQRKTNSHLYFPPFEIDKENRQLTKAHDGGTEKDLLEYWEERGEDPYYKTEPVPFENLSKCFFWPIGTAPPQLLALEEVLVHFKAFSKDQTEKGDACVRNEELEEALNFYAKAASVLHTPESYSRMLLLPMSDSQRVKIEKLLAHVASLSPPSLHVDQMRKELGFDYSDQ